MKYRTSFTAVFLILSLLVTAWQIHIFAGENNDDKEKVAGITHTYTSGFHLLTIDLNAGIRFETVFADDAWDGRSGETVASMATRHGAIAGVNTDYFDSTYYTHGAEGMAYRLGTKYRCEKWRSSLAISSDNRVSIDMGFENDPGDHDCAGRGNRTDATLLYNVVGGGPQFVFSGQAEWNRNGDEVNGENFPGSSYWDNGNSRMTAIGVSSNGNSMYIAVSDGGKTPLAAAQFLANQGAWTAIKFDGGGSSQLYYNGQTLVGSSREVAEALLIFESDVCGCPCIP